MLQPILDRLQAFDATLHLPIHHPYWQATGRPVADPELHHRHPTCYYYLHDVGTYPSGQPLATRTLMTRLVLPISIYPFA